MTKTDLGMIMGALALWAPAMVLPVLLMYFKNVPFKIFTLTLIYPLMLSILSRVGRFWVTRTAIAYASLATLLLSYLLTLNKNNVEAIENPEKDQTRSALLFSAIVFTFLMAMGLTGVIIEPLYSPANFGGSSMTVPAAPSMGATGGGMTSFGR